MPISDLERNGFIRRHTCSTDDVQQAMARAKDELEAAGLLAERHPASAYELAYNAMLFAISALLHHEGYRAAAERHHATLVQFAEAKLGLSHLPLVDAMDAARRKRHRTVYEQASVSRKETRHILEVAAEVIAVVEHEIEG